MASKKESADAAAAAADRIKAATLNAAKGLSRAQAERAAAAAARNVNAYGQKEEGPSKWQERKEAKRQMYLMSTEKAVKLGVRKDAKPGAAGGGAQRCQNCFQNGHWTYECKNERVYISRPTRSQQLKNPKLCTPFMDASELDTIREPRSLERDARRDIEMAKKDRKRGKDKKRRKKKSRPSISSSSEESESELTSPSESSKYSESSDSESSDSESSISDSTSYSDDSSSDYSSDDASRKRRKSKGKQTSVSRNRRRSRSSSSDSSSDDSLRKRRKSKRKQTSSSGNRRRNKSRN